jgi:hypothetical protein
MAASIPILRVLIRDVTSPSNRFYASYSRRMAAHMGSPRDGGNMAAVEANPSFVLSYRSDLGMLDGNPISGGGSPLSMRGMPLPSPMPMPGAGQVLKTSEVRLEYGYREERYLPQDSSESLPRAYGYEMSRNMGQRGEKVDEEKVGRAV